MQYDNAIVLFKKILIHLDKSWQKIKLDESNSWIEELESSRILLLKNLNQVESSLKNENSTQLDDQFKKISQKIIKIFNIHILLLELYDLRNLIFL